MMRDDWMTWGLGGMWFVHLIWIALVAALAWFLYDRLRQEGRARPCWEPGETARRILDERYAKGEIDQAEYEARRKGLAH